MNVFDDFIYPMIQLLGQAFELIKDLLFYRIELLGGVRVINLLGVIGAGTIIFVLIIKVIRG